MKKRGQSQITAIILLILIAIIAILILGNLLSIFNLKAETEVGMEGFILDARIKYVNLNKDKTEATIGLYRPSGKGEIKGVKFIFEDKNLKTHLYEDRTTSLKEIETKEFKTTSNSLKPPIVNFSEIKKISVAYIFERKGVERFTPVLDVYDVEERGFNTGGSKNSGIPKKSIPISSSNQKVLDKPNQYYYLTNNLENNTLIGPFINISAPNITLDCAGYWIKSTNNVSGIYSNQFNTTIKNCNITVGSGDNNYARGIELDNGADYSRILNNLLINNTHGIYSDRVQNIIIKNNLMFFTGIPFGPQVNGMYFTNLNNSIISNNTVKGYNGFGFQFIGGNNLSILNNYAKSNSSYGFRFTIIHNSFIMNNTGISNVSYGLFLSSKSNNNNTFNFNRGISNSGAGLLLAGDNHNLSNNLGISNSGKGIFITDLSNSILRNNTGISNSSYGINSNWGSINNVFISNTAKSNSSYGIYYHSQSYVNPKFHSYNNTFINTNTTGTYGFFIQGAFNSSFIDCINIKGSVYDVYVKGGSSRGLYIDNFVGNNKFLNCSYNKGFVNATNTTLKNTLIRKWYYQAYVEKNGIPVNNAKVLIYDKKGVLQFDLLTNSSGWIERQELIDYIYSDNQREYYSDYTITVTSGSSSKSRSHNLTKEENIVDIFSL
jgi:hypothetical protein